MSKTLGEEAPLTEDGYQQVAAKTDNDEMTKYMKRVVTDAGLKIIDASPLCGVVPYYSGATAVQDLARMKNELRGFSWIKPAVNGSNAPLTEDGYQALAMLKNNSEMLDFAKRFLAVHNMSCTDDGKMSGLIPHYSGDIAVQSLARMQEEFLGADWVTKPKPETAEAPYVPPKPPAQPPKPVEAPTDATISWWNPNAMCGGASAQDRAKWLMDTQGMSADKAREQVKSEFPDAFKNGGTASWWHPDAICDGTPAQDRAKWLMDNQNLSEDAAREQVRSEFPFVFFGGVGAGGSKGASASFGERLSSVNNKLRFEIRPDNPAGISLVAVHYSIDGSAEQNFDITQMDASTNAWVHETPEGEAYPSCPPGASVKYWLYLIRNGVGAQEPSDATSEANARLEVRV